MNDSLKYFTSIQSYSLLMHADVKHISGKSFPRSGHHLLKNYLKLLYLDDFEYCEFYNSETCCKIMPCAKYATDRICIGVHKKNIFMQKSHDFELTDTIFAASHSFFHVIQYREPIGALLSYFQLCEIIKYSDFLSANNIPFSVDFNQLEDFQNKIFNSYSNSINSDALQFLYHSGKYSDKEYFYKWLIENSSYYSSFIDKWCLLCYELHGHKHLYIDYVDLINPTDIFFNKIKNYFGFTEPQKLTEHVRDILGYNLGITPYYTDLFSNNMAVIENILIKSTDAYNKARHKLNS